jgi:hypothetical protein
MNEPKLHHYVPQFYLRRFADQSGRLWVWNKIDQRVYPTSSNTIAAERHIYRVPEFIGTKQDPLFLEKQLSNLEGEAATVTQRWIDSLQTMNPSETLTISNKDRSLVAFYMSVQFLRTAEQKEILALLAADIGKYKDGISPEELTNLHAYLLCAEGPVDDIAKRICNSVWVFAKNTSGTPLWTSDNPVCFKSKDNSMWLKGPNAFIPGSYAVFPLTPTYVLYCKDREYWRDLEKFDCSFSPVQLTTEFVEHENAGQVFMAKRSVVSPSNDFSFADSFVKTIGTDLYKPKG